LGPFLGRKIEKVKEKKKKKKKKIKKKKRKEKEIPPFFPPGETPEL